LGITVLCAVIGALHAQTIPGIRGIDQGLFQYHFDRADRETDPASWMEQARLGRELALGSWERTALELYEDPALRAGAAGDLARWSEEELERRFAQWLSKRFFGAGSGETALALLKTASEANRIYAYHTDDDGNIIYNDDSGDPEAVRPFEGRDAETDRLSWRAFVSHTGEAELGAYADTLSAYFPELLFYVPEENREAFQNSLASVYSEALSSREAEFKALLAREERLFIARRSGDIWSLRKKSENESASAITSLLVKEADALSAEGIASLERRIESARSGSGDLSLAGADWLNDFQAQFEKGLKAWETAEEQFLIRRMEWERDSGEYFLAGQEAWQNAFSELEKERLVWEEQARELFRAGEELFSGVSEQLRYAITEAKAEFEKDAELRINNGVERARSWVDMYITCASVLAETRESVTFWLGRFVNDTPPSLDGGTLSVWANGILDSGRVLNAEQRMAGQELVRWSELYIQYRDRAEEARTALETEFALALGSNAGGLTDVLGAASEDFHLDEYQVEILRARAVAGYWDQRLAVAEAVSAYAEELTAGRQTEAESLSAWREAKAVYDAALASYSVVQEQLRAANLSVAQAREEMSRTALALDNAERRLEELNANYALQMASYRINSRDFILEELGSYYASLIAQREKREQDGAYYTGYLKALRDYAETSNLAESWQKLGSVVTEPEAAGLRAMKLALLGAESAVDWYFVFSEKESTAEERRLLEEEGLFRRLKTESESGGERAALLLEVYRELAPYSRAAREEAVLSALNGMGRIFAEYGIEAADGMLPSAGLIGKALFRYADQQGIDYGEAAAKFFVRIDEETVFVPDWIEQETASWKSAALVYLAAKTVYDGKTPAETSLSVSEMYRERREKLQALYLYDLYLSTGEIPGFERPEEDYQTLAGETAYYSYLYEYLAAYENNLAVIDAAEPGAEHWRTYISSPFFDLYNLNKDESVQINAAAAGNPEDETGGIKGALSWEEGLLADAWENAEQEQEKLEKAFSLFLDRPSGSSGILFVETAKKYLDDPELAWENLFDETAPLIQYEFYVEEQNKLAALSGTGGFLAAEISRLGLGFSGTPAGGIEAREELERISGELEELRLGYESAFAQYAEAADTFARAGSVYEGIYTQAKNLFAATEKARLEYEKQDAIRRWAATAYLYNSGEHIETAYYMEPREELAYAGERAGRARTALQALKDLYGGGEEKRPYEDEEYNRLYEEYKVSFSRMFLAMKAMSELENATAFEKGNNAALYGSLSVQASSYINPALVEFFPDSETPAENPWFNYLGLTDGGRLSLSYDPVTFELQNFSDLFSAETYFENDPYAIEGSLRTSAFESALAEWSVRMESYRLDNMGNFTRWGLAFDYLVRRLIESNPGIEGIGGSYTLSDLGENGSLKLNGTRLDSIVRHFSEGRLPDAQRAAYDSLSDAEKADLEFFAALALSGGGGAGAGGLTRASEWYEMQWLYSKADSYRHKIKISLLFTSITLVVYDWPYTFDSSEVDYIRDFSKGRANSIYSMIYSERNEYANAAAGLSRTWRDYQKSCENLTVFLGAKNGQPSVWSDIEKALAVLQVFNEEEISDMEESWNEMLAYHDRQGISLSFANNASALETLVSWTKGNRNSVKQRFEAAYAADEDQRGDAQDEYRRILELYIDGKAPLSELNSAAEEAYGEHSPAIKNHLENLGSAMLSDLEGAGGEKNGYAFQFRELALEYEELIERVYKSRFDAELASREIEWGKQQEDLAQKIASWKEASGLILERGRNDWKAGLENMLAGSEKWARSFQEEYGRIDAAWNAAYLECLQDKEAWISGAVEAADNALQGALLSFVGSEAEAGSRKLSTFFPSALPGYGGAEEAGKILQDVLASAGIKGLAGAFGAVNGNAQTAGIALRSGNSGLGLWNTGQAYTAARELARNGTADVAAQKMKILALQARESALKAKVQLDQNIENANRDFDKGMDETFVMGSGWARSGSLYVRDIIVHSTLFHSVITDRVTVDSYKWFIMEYWDFTTNLSDAYLEGLDYFAIETLIGLAQNEVRQKSETVFGNAFGESGLFAEWIGEAPEMANGSFVKEGSGELGRLLRKYYTYAIKQSRGIDLVNAAPWEKPLWDSRGSGFSAPSLRSVADIAMAAASAVAVAVSPLTGGASLALGVAINLMDDALFTALDVNGGYKSLDKAGFAFGQKALMTTVTSAAGAAFSGFGKVAEGSTGFFNTGGLSGYIDRAMDQGFGKVMSLGALSGARAFTAGTITSALGAVTYSGENGFGWSQGSFISGLRGSLAGAAVAGTGSLAGGALNLGLEGFYGQYYADGSKLSSVIGGLGGQGVNLAMEGDLTLNVFNLGFVNRDLASTGLLELHLGKDGFNAQMGTGGADVSAETLASALRGLEAWKVNFEIWNSGSTDANKYISQMRSLYSGSIVNNAEYDSILAGTTRILEDRNVRETQSEYNSANGIKYVILGTDTLEDDSRFGLNVVFGHESYRNGVDDGNEGQVFETNQAVIGHIVTALGLMQTYGAGSLGPAMTEEAKSFLENYTVLVNENSSLDDQLNAAAMLGAILTSYDSSADYWKMRLDGTLVYDDSGWLKDEEGKYISLNGGRTSSVKEGSTIGAANIKQGLLNILYGGTSNEPLNGYSQKQQNLARDLIIATGNVMGAGLDMNSVMSFAGGTIAGTVFQTYYNNTIDYNLASIHNVDLIFNTRGNWNVNLLPRAAVQRYTETVAGRINSYISSEGSVEKALLNKYITTVDFSDGTSKNLLKITQDNPYVSMLLNQNDPVFRNTNSSQYNYDLWQWGCNFMSTIAVPQLLTGDIFNAQTVTNVWNQAVSDKVIRSDGLVYDATSLATYALKNVIGVNNITVTTTKDSLAKPSANSMRIAIKEQYDPSHFVLDDLDRRLVYNPWPGLIRTHERYDGIFLQPSYYGR
jgi:hypothetical protein